MLIGVTDFQETKDVSLIDTSCYYEIFDAMMTSLCVL